MASPKNPPNDLAKKVRRDRFAATIQHRLGIDEEWFAVTNRPSFFDSMDRARLGAFEKALGRVVKLGCRWEVVLTCLAAYYTYNAREIVTRHATYDSEGELTRLPEKVWKPESADRPPDSEARRRILRNLNAAAGDINTYENLLIMMGRFDPPPPIVWPDRTNDANKDDIRIAAADAVLYAQGLLKWCQKLLSDDSLGNFRTVETIGQLIPCVYVEVVVPKPQPGRRKRLPLEQVAELLNAISGERRHNQRQLRTALNRFERNYPEVHRQLRAKIEDLHRTASESADGWRRIFEMEDRRRSR